MSTTRNACNNTLVGQSGTGAYVGTASPTMTTPTIGAALATSIKFTGSSGELIDKNGNGILALVPTGSAVNFVEILNATTGNPPLITAFSGATNLALELAGKGNAGVYILGQSTGSNVAAGLVGELISSYISSMSAVSLSTGTPNDLTSISLTAGDWDVYGNVSITPSIAVSDASAWISLTSATRPDESLYSRMVATGIGAFCGPVPFVQVNVSTTTTVYISGQATFGSGTCTMSGGIYARRRT